MKIPCYFDSRFDPPASFVRATVDLVSKKALKPKIGEHILKEAAYV